MWIKGTASIAYVSFSFNMKSWYIPRTKVDIKEQLLFFFSKRMKNVEVIFRFKTIVNHINWVWVDWEIIPND